MIIMSGGDCWGYTNGKATVCSRVEKENEKDRL